MKRVSIYLVALTLVGLAILHSAKGQASAPFPTYVVAKAAFVGQTGNLPATTVYTPLVTGDYRLSMYVDQPTYQGSYPCVYWTWTDDFSAQINATGACTGGGSTSVFGSNDVFVRALAGQPIQITSQGSASGPFNVYVTVEQVGLH